MVGYTVPGTMLKHFTYKISLSFTKNAMRTLKNLCFTDEGTEALVKLNNGTQVRHGNGASFKSMQLVQSHRAHAGNRSLGLRVNIALLKFLTFFPLNLCFRSAVSQDSAVALGTWSFSSPVVQSRQLWVLLRQVLCSPSTHPSKLPFFPGANDC